MKKIFWIILLLIPICHVKAETYYSDYSNWKKVEKIPNIASDLLEVKEEKVYLWYQVVREGKYFKEEENKGDYSIKTDFYTYTNWSDWSSLKPNEKEGIQIERRNVYDYQTMLPIKYIRISQIKGGNINFLTSHIYKKQREINYKQRREGNDIIFEIEPCYVDELEIALTLFDDTDDEKAFKIEWFNNLNEESFMYNDIRFWFQGVYQISFQYRNMVENSIKWNEVMSSLERVENNIHQKVSVKEEFRYKERMTYFERERRVYREEYSNSPFNDYPYCDLESEKENILIRTRRKKEFNQENFISLNEYEKEVQKYKKEISFYQQRIEELEQNIHSYQENLKELEKDSILNQDKILELKEKIILYEQEIENFKGKMNFANEEISRLEIEKENINKNNLEKIEQLEGKLEEANVTIMELANEKSNQKEKASKEKTELKKQSLLFPFVIFFIFLLIGMIVSRILTMKKKL